MISENVYLLSKSNNRRLKLRVDLLSFSYVVLASLEGNCLSGSIQIDANADIRRVANVELVVTNSSFDIGEDRKIWLDKYIQIYQGMVDNNGVTEWINMGIYLIDNPSLIYNSTTHTLSFTAYDLMSKMTGLRNGQLKGIPSLIPRGSSIKGAMSNAVSQLGGFNKFIIIDNPQDVPYDILIDTGGTVYDIAAKLRDISAEWEIFFDVDGVYHYQPIEAYNDDSIFADDDIFDYVVIQVEDNVDFQNVKNVIEVFGKSYDPVRYGDVASLSGSTYSISLDDFDQIPPNITIGFTTPSNNGSVSNAKLKINNLPALPLVNEDGTNVTISESNEYLVVSSPTKLLIGTSSDNPTYDVQAVVDEQDGSYKVELEGLDTWQSNTAFTITLPNPKIILNGDIEYTISNLFDIPPMGSICYFKVGTSNTMTKVSATNADYIIENVTAKTCNFYITINGINSLPINTIIGVVMPYISPNPNIKINDFAPCQIYNSNGVGKYNLNLLSAQFILKIPAITNLLYLGHQQIHAELKETNPESPYYIGKDLGEIRLVLKDGEYSNIYTDDLARQRARYELYLHCRMEDTLTITMVPVYWLDVNKKISFTYDNKTFTYIIKSIDVDLSPSGLMTINVTRFYPQFET